MLSKNQLLITVFNSNSSDKFVVTIFIMITVNPVCVHTVTYQTILRFDYINDDWKSSSQMVSPYIIGFKK
ncbi:MAG: hypothetical protein WKF97_00405 [Chitinophagaceae bacterium]